MKLIELLTSPWAIVPESLREIQQIYMAHRDGERVDLSTVEARVGHPLANEQQTYTVREGGVAVLAVDGIIAPKANMFTQISGGVSAQMLVAQIQSAKADSRVRAMVQLVDSPGGSVFGTPEWAAAVADFATVKPIVTLSDATLQSAAYWGGAAANAVYLTGPTVEAGSIGVISRMALSQADPGSMEFVRGKYKRGGINGQAPSSDFIAYYEARLDHLYSVFVDAVATYRGVTSDVVLEQMADGRSFIGQQAIDAGLADGFISLDQLVEQLATNPDAFTQGRKVRVAASASPAPAAVPAQQPPVSQTLEGVSMNRAELAAQHPELLQTILAEGQAAGATAERTRIQSVEAALIPGHEALIAGLKFDGKTSGGDAAMAVNQAERGIREAQGKANTADAPKVIASAPAPTVAAVGADAAAAAEAQRIAALPIADRCKAQFEASSALQGEFRSLAAYTAWAEADAKGLAKVKKTS